MNKNEIDYLSTIWPAYFPNDIFHPSDKRIGAVSLFKSYLQGSGRFIFENQKDKEDSSIELDLSILQEVLPFPDFIITLRTQPNEVLGCLGLALSSLRAMENPITSKLEKFYAIRPKIINLEPHTPFSALKSNISGQLISLCGHVIRVSPAQPYVTIGAFKCSKCHAVVRKTFNDGIYSPPTQCSTLKCKNKYLDFQRSLAITSDLQRVKLQEYIDPDKQDNSNEYQNDVDGPSVILTPNVPRTFEVELRGEELVDSCVSGDIVIMVGIVKAVQQEMFRGGRGREEKRESGIHQLYLDVISITPLQKQKKKRSRSSSSPPSSSLSIDSFDISETNSNLTSEERLRRKHDSDLIYQQEMLFIRSLALSPYCMSLLLSAFCPTIFGHELVKLGLLLGLFGGSKHSQQSNENETFQPISSSFNIRSEIHVLVVGDPGLGKSQMLRAAGRIAPRSVMVCGNTASTAGLTVALVRDSSNGGEMSIEAGALVLADRGVCCIDELDKMTCDPHSLLEAMEQQSVSVAKSGVVTSLRSRATILAAANPSGGCYDRRKSVSENLKMASALLSRFDLVFIMLDKPDAGRDKMISEHIMSRSTDSNHLNFSDSHNSHNNIPSMWSTQQSQSSNIGGSINNIHSTQSQNNLSTLAQRIRNGLEELRYITSSQYSELSQRLSSSNTSSNSLLGINTLYDLLMNNSSTEYLRKYIEYSRQYCHPSLTPEAAKVLQKHYLTMRSNHSNSGKDSIPVTTRHLESLIRLSQARARIELRNEVSESDAIDVVNLLHESLLDTITLDTGQVDFNRKGGMSMAKQVKALTSVLRKESERKGSNLFSLHEIHDFVQLLKLKGNTEAIVDVMRTESYLLLKGNKLYQLL